MKKILFALVASFIFSMGTMAQDQKQEGRERPQFNPAEMAQRRTEGMVKKYGLNEDQAAKLLDLNTKFTDKMGPRQGMRRAPRHDGAAPDTARKARPQRMDRRGGRGAMPEEMRKNFEAYNTELKNILTEDQYKAYEEDMKKRPQRHGDGGRGQHQRHE